MRRGKMTSVRADKCRSMKETQAVNSMPALQLLLWNKRARARECGTPNIKLYRALTRDILCINNKNSRYYRLILLVEILLIAVLYF